MRLKLTLLGCALAAAVALPVQAASLVNQGFETGDLSGWSYSPGYVDIVTDTDDAIVTPPSGEHFTATEGSYFAQVTAGPDAGFYATLSQTFTLSAASFLSFDAAFLAFDYLPYDDDAYVRVYSVSTNEVMFASSVSAVGDQGHTSWAHFTSSLLGSGSYVLEAGVRNIDDADPTYSSRLLLDGVSIAAGPGGGVPEPASWAMMIFGFGGVGAILRRRRGLAFA